jgi:hypothetical protein
MKRENRYIVIKRKDLAPNVPLDMLEEFEEVFSKVSPLLPARECVVVESDWPEYEHVWELIRLRVENAEIPAETVQGVVDAPAVDAALRAFTDDATNDNAFFLVRAIMEACLPREPKTFDSVKEGLAATKSGDTFKVGKPTFGPGDR